MNRSTQKEILELSEVSESIVTQVYRQLTRIHRLLGDTASVMSALRRDPLPVHRVMDIGCASGGVLLDIRHKLRVDVVGVDISPPRAADLPFPILRADAVRDQLPQADVAFSMYLGHHLSEEDLVNLIINVGRFCRRFILLDLVRHPLPLGLFRAFVAPFVCPIVFADGQTSIRRSYTRTEARRIVSQALAGSNGVFRHSVAPLYIRQIIDISYSPKPAPAERSGVPS
jgi:SAM-dependent methyltransferase